MANTNLTTGAFNQALSGVQARGLITQEHNLDFNAGTGTNRAENLVMNLFKVPKGTHVVDVTTQIIQVCTTGVTIDIGDWSSAATEIVVDLDGWLDGGDVTGAIGTILSGWSATLTDGTPNTIAPPYKFGKTYIVDNYIAMKILGADAVLGKLQVRSHMMI